MSLHAIVVALVVLLGCAQSSAEVPRSMNDLEPAISGLLASSADDAFLIVLISGTPDFVQISGYRGTAELDFPQITDRQKELRPKIEAVCGDLGLALKVTRGPGGLEFLDYDLPSEVGQIVNILRRILSEVYEVLETSELEFETNGFEIPTA